MLFSGKDSRSDDSCRLIAPKTIFNPLFDTVLPAKLKRGVGKLNLQFAGGLFDVKSSQKPGGRGFSQLRTTEAHLRVGDEFRGKRGTRARHGTATSTELSQDVCRHPEHHGGGGFGFLFLGLSSASFRYDQTLGAEGPQPPVVPTEPKNLPNSHNLQLELQVLW